jgi:glutamine cyclotransferase|tara:strand:- start:1933 stop:2424 length:492 start_codon:yes stop_codon:yes gene_type:complete
LVLERERETLQLLREVELPPGVEGWGLTHDGSSTLYASDGSSQLRLLDPQSLQTRRVMTVRCGSRELNGINELQWIRGHVWANLWREDRLASIDPNTGKVLFFVNLEPIITKGERRKLGEEEVLNGIAYDARGDRLWVTGKCWPNLFQIAVDEAGVGLGQEPP